MSYKILRVVEAEEVPDWERHPPKWADLVDDVLALKPGKTLEVGFDEARVAKRARDAVRDQANLKAKAVVVRTRVVVNKKDGSAILYLTRVNPSDANPPE